MRKHKNPRQERILVNFMIAHRNILALGYNKGRKAEFDALWELLTKKLNAEGPPVKDCCYWKKSWSDWKICIKRKIKARLTDESKQLSKSEAIVAQLCKLNEMGEGELSSLTSLNDANSYSNFDNETQTNQLPDTQTVFTTNEADTKSNHPIDSPDSTKSSFEASDDSNCIKQFANNLSGNSLTTSDLMKIVAESLDNWCTLNAERNKETARHNRVMEDLEREKIAIKMRSLELQELQYKMEKEKFDLNRVKMETE